jgi:outer membrane receptor protein involved in Fe transport
LWVGIGLAVSGGWAVAGHAAESELIFNIPAQRLSDALNVFGRQAGLSIAFYDELVAGRTTDAVSGKFTAEAALERLLLKTGLHYRFVNEKTVAISGDKSREADGDRTSQAALGRESLRLAQADVGAGAYAQQPASNPDSNSAPAIEEILVTAQKRMERLQEVPVPVSVVNADKLIGSNQLLLRDYYASVPGLNLAPGGQSQQFLTIRGISTGPGNPTVGVTVDDAPYGASTSDGGGNVVPDIDPGDLARVEVLRGPQGTLYGASSLGGLLKFVTVDPSTDALSGRVQVGTSRVHNGDQLGYDVHGSVNVPLGDTLAVRASAFSRQEAGYIDNPVLNIEGVNEARVNGGRLSALWRPSEMLSLKLSALFQEAKGDGTSDVLVDSGLADLQQNFLRGTGAFERKAQAYTAVLSVTPGRFDIKSITGFNVNEFSQSDDFSPFADLAEGLFGVHGAAIASHNQTEKFTQEVRVSAPIGERFEWLAGGFYAHEDSPYRQDVFAIDPATGARAGEVIFADFPSKYEEYAAFANLTFHLTDRFDVQVGGRQSHAEKNFSQTNGGRIFDDIERAVRPPESAGADAFTYLVTPRFKFSPNLMAYVRLASGYRAGGSNPIAATIPDGYDPDKTQNYELGLKADFFDRLLSVDSSLYYIDWKDIQLNVRDPASGNFYFTNASRARAQGVELSVESHPVDGLLLAAWVAWNDAELTEALPPESVAAGVYALKGDRLPFSSRFSAHGSIEHEFPLAGTLRGFAGADVSYVGERLNQFTSSATVTRRKFPAYAKTDVRVGARSDAWTFNLFINNAADRRGVLQSGVDDDSVIYIQPRTVGASVSRSF